MHFPATLGAPKVDQEALEDNAPSWCTDLWRDDSDVEAAEGHGFLG